MTLILIGSLTPEQNAFYSLAQSDVNREQNNSTERSVRTAERVSLLQAFYHVGTCSHDQIIEPLLMCFNNTNAVLPLCLIKFVA